MKASGTRINVLQMPGSLVNEGITEAAPLSTPNSRHSDASPLKESWGFSSIIISAKWQ